MIVRKKRFLFATLLFLLAGLIWNPMKPDEKQIDVIILYEK